MGLFTGLLHPGGGVYSEFKLPKLPRGEMRFFLGKTLDIWDKQMYAYIHSRSGCPNLWRKENKRLQMIADFVAPALEMGDSSHARYILDTIRYGILEPYDVDFPNRVFNDPDSSSTEASVVKMHAIIKGLNSGTILGPWKLKRDRRGRRIIPNIRIWDAKSSSFQQLKLRFHPTIAVKKKLNPHGRACADLKTSGHNNFIHDHLAHVVLPQPIEIVHFLTGKRSLAVIDYVSAFLSWGTNKSQWGRYAFSYKDFMFIYTCLVFGLKTGSKRFCEISQALLDGFRFHFPEKFTGKHECKVYVDDNLFASERADGAAAMTKIATEVFDKLGIKYTLEVAPGPKGRFIGWFNDLQGQYCRLPKKKAKEIRVRIKELLDIRKGKLYTKEQLQMIAGSLEHYARLNHCVKKNLSALTRLIAGLAEKQSIRFFWRKQYHCLKNQMKICLKEVTENTKIFYKWFDIRSYVVSKPMFIDASLKHFGVGGVIPDDISFQLPGRFYKAWLLGIMERNLQRNR